MENIKIETLKGPERVRKRPAVIFGSDGAEGAATAIKTLLNIFVTEAALGYSKGIDLSILKDSTISVRSYDRGLLLDETIIDGKPGWYQLFCQLYCGPREPDDEYYIGLGRHHNDLYEKVGTPMPEYQIDCDHCFDLCCVQYASAFMHIEATRDGIKKTLGFEKGCSISDLQKEPSSAPANTYIHFQIDPEVFQSVSISMSEITDYLQDAAITIPGLKCVIFDERSGIEHTFLYPKGAADYAGEIAPPVAIPFFTNALEATGKDRYNHREYCAKVKLVFGFAKDASHIRCLHNYRELEYGGHHLDAVKEQLLRYINWEFAWDLKAEASPNDEDSDGLESGFTLSFDDIKENILLILETNCTQYASMYVNATQKAIKNRMIADMAHDLIDKEFGYYLKQNQEAIRCILKAARQRKQNSQAENS